MLEGAETRPAQGNGGGHGGGTLLGVGVSQRKFKSRIGKGKILKPQILDETAIRGVAFQSHEGGRKRSDHLNLRHVFAGLRVIKELAGAAIQIPLARCVQGLEYIFHDVTRAVLGEIIRECLVRLVGEGDEIGRGVHALNGQMRIRPEMIDDDFHILKIAPVRPDVARLELKTLTPLVIVGRLRRAFRAARHTQETLIRRAGTDTLLAVHIKLAEIPLAAGHFRQSGHPNFGVMLLPTSDAAAAIQNRRHRSRRLVSDGKGGRAGILRPEPHFPRQRIIAAGQPHGDRLLERAGLLQLADGVAGALHGGKRFGLRAGIGIAAVRRDVKVSGRGDGGDERQGAHDDAGNVCAHYFFGSAEFVRGDCFCSSIIPGASCFKL